VVYFKYQKKGGANDLMDVTVCVAILIALTPFVLTVLIVLAGVGWK
jgi:hypothetical protein